MGQLLVTGVLSGMMAKNTYRQGAYGPILDRQAGASDAFAAGQKTGQDWRQAPQKLSDDMMARKLSTVAANVQAAHGYAAMTQAQFAAQKEGTEAEAAQDAIWQKTADQNKAIILASADEYDKNRQTGDPSAYLTRGQTWDELMSSPFKSNMTSQLMVQDGMRPQYDEHLGRTKMVPTFSVLNPAVKVKLNEDTVARIAKFNSTFGNDLFKATNGNVQLGLNQLAMLTHQGSSIMHAEATLQSLSDSKDDLASKLGITGNIEDRLAAASRDNSSVWKSLSEFENGQAHGGNTADQLQRILQSDGGDAIFKALGTDRDKVQKFITDYNARIKATNKLAEEGGIGPHAPVTPDETNATLDAIKTNKDLSNDDRKLILSKVPKPDKDGVIHMNRGELDKIDSMTREMITSNKSNSTRTLLAGGDPATVDAFAHAVVEGDLDSFKMFPNRGDGRPKAVLAARNLAQQRGLDTTRFSDGVMESKAKTYADYAGDKKGTTGAQIASFNTLVGHIMESVNLEQKLAGKTIGLTRSPWVNTASDKIGKEFANDPDWKAYQASIAPVQNEYANLLAAGYSPKEDDAALIRQIVDPHETPARIEAALKQLATTADIRLANMGQRFQDTLDTNYPHLISNDSLNAFRNLGIKSKAEPLSGDLPRGWAGDGSQFSPITPAAKTAYFAAANGNPKRAAAMAKLNGWAQSNGQPF
jgi:cell pole-organizing protein PopZ